MHAGVAASDAETLMRSRYTAFVLRNEAYLLGTWHPSTRPERLDLAEDTTRWIGLTIRRHESTGPDRACVEFVARYRIHGRAHRLHETSRFVREGGQWFYVDGDVKD
ncbi:MAG TPA: YchJ family metal-binding protein [Azoarcus sp.]|nr:YchJ family metal-binding protein [Azoarcus sp.]